MIEIIGQIHCSRCEMAKKSLENKNIEFTYKLITDVDNVDEITKKAEDAKMMNFPLIFKDGEIVTLQEVII